MDKRDIAEEAAEILMMMGIEDAEFFRNMIVKYARKKGLVK